MTGDQPVLLVQCGLNDAADRGHVVAMTKAGYAVEECAGERYSLALAEKVQPFVVCFEYAYPDLPGLAHLQTTKQRLPSIPVLMLTEAHSEALAVWAFRTRVWDYFVHPVDMTRLLEVLSVLTKLRTPERRDTQHRDMLAAPHAIPAEARLRPDRPADDGPALDQVIAYMDRNLAAKISQAEMAALCNLSPFQFSRAFKRRFGTTFQDYLLRRRITEAMRLLGHPQASITDVCYAAGFRDLSYFTRTFHRFVGRAPSVYRQECARLRSAAPTTGPLLGVLPLIPADEQHSPG